MPEFCLAAARGPAVHRVYICPTERFTRSDLSSQSDYARFSYAASDGPSERIDNPDVPCSHRIYRGWAYTLNGNGFTTTIIPINYNSCQRTDTIDGCKDDGRPTTLP